MRFLNLEWVPLNIPLERRLQTFSVLLYLLAFTSLGTFSVWFLVFLLFTPFFWVTWLYGIWYIYDFNRGSRGGRRFEWARRFRIWTWFRDYFPIRLVTTAELDPEHNYVIGSHPHGLFNLGIATNFTSEVNGISQRFSGITIYFLVLKLLLYLPLSREYMMAFGVCDVSAESIHYVMKEKGTAVVIVVGGAKEVIDARPGLARLVLKNRKGFVKIAIQNGAYLVPSFTFGENELYRQALNNAPGSRIRSFQQWMQSKTGLAPPVLFFGRGIFNYTLGMLPRRVPLVTIVGRPIPVERDANPSQEYIDEVHARYMRELKLLFDDHKTECGYPDQEIEFI